MSELLVTVGSNPLPVVAAILHLGPATVHYVYTSQVGQNVERIRALVGVKGVATGHVFEIADPYRATAVATVLNDRAAALRTTPLHYTGGTKAMVVHTRMWWKGAPSDATYIGPDGYLYSDDSAVAAQPLRDAPRLTLEELCNLHFGRPFADTDYRRSEALAQKMQALVSTSGWAAVKAWLPPLYGKRVAITVAAPPLSLDRVEYQAAYEQNFRDPAPLTTLPLDPLCRALEISGTTIDDVCHELDRRPRAEDRLAAGKWLWGTWLEVWLAAQLASATDSGDGTRALFDEVHHNVKVGTYPFDLEADVVGVRGHRVFLFSCTVDQDRGRVKQKLFEAASRTARIGGDLARAAVVSMSPEPGAVLVSAKAENWDGYGTLRAFGAEHIKGNCAPCTVSTAGASGPPKSLIEGVREWVLS